jgi:hypothetical protein
MDLNLHDVIRELVGAAAKAGTLGEARALALLDAVNGDDPRVAEEAARPPEFTPEDQKAYDELAARREAAQAPRAAPAAGTSMDWAGRGAPPPGRSLFAPTR